MRVTTLPYFYDNALYAMQVRVENTTPTQEAMRDGIFTLVFRYIPVGGNPDVSDSLPITTEYLSAVHHR